MKKEKEFFSQQLGLEQWITMGGKINLDPYLTLYIKINLK